MKGIRLRFQSDNTTAMRSWKTGDVNAVPYLMLFEDDKGNMVLERRDIE